MPKFHGIELAKNSNIKNAVVESLAADPLVTEAGRAWYNSTSKTWKMSTLDALGAVVIKTYATKEEVDAALLQYQTDIASTTAGKGTGLVGFSGKTGANALFSVTAGTTEAALTSIVTAIDASKQEEIDLDTRVTSVESQVNGKIGELTDLHTTEKGTVVGALNEVQDELDAYKVDVASTVAGKGTGLVGFVGKAGANSQFSVTAGTTEAALTSIVTEVDQIDQDVADLQEYLDTNFLNKTTASSQTVAADVIFNGNVKVVGDILQQGDVKIVVGEEVLFEDNIVILNSNVAADATPTEDAGWGVNRGAEGELVVVKWDEINDVIKGVKEFTAEGLPVYDTFAFDSELDAVETALDARLTTVESQVNGKIGELTDLHTTEKGTVVGAVNEVQDELDAYKTAVAASTGAGLVGYTGLTGLNNLAVIAAGTVTATLDSLVTFIDAEAKAADDRIADETSLVAGKGSGLIGFVGKAGTNEQFSITAGTTEAALVSIVSAIDADKQDLDDQVASYASTVVSEGAGLVGFSGQTGTNGQYSVTATTVETALKSIVNEVDGLEQTVQDNIGNANTRIDNLVTAVNATKYKTTSASATVHTITHNLNSQEIAVNVWVKDGMVWKNHIVGQTIIDANKVQIDLTEAFEIKVLVEKFDAVTA